MYKLAENVKKDVLKEYGFSVEKEAAFKTVKDETCYGGENQVVIDFEEENEIYLNFGNDDVSPYIQDLIAKGLVVEC